MTVETATIHNHLVMRDDINTFRWYDAFGPNVLKYLEDFTDLPVDDQTHDPDNWTMSVTEVGGTTTTQVSDIQGGGLLITGAGNEDDGVQMQLGHASDGAGENVSFSGDYPTYFGVKFQVADADQSDVLFGFAVTDTDCLGGVTDGLYFRSADESASAYIVLEKDSNESATAAGTISDATDITLEFLYYAHNVEVYVDGSLAATIADSDDNFPNDELLRLTMEFLSGEAAANTCTVKWIRFMQILG